jgi:hypothetical protein
MRLTKVAPEPPNRFSWKPRSDGGPVNTAVRRLSSCYESEIVETKRVFQSIYNCDSKQNVKKPSYGIRLTCPCCGYPTLGERTSYEICFLCSWEDDGQDDQGADEIRGGLNHGYSLTEARENFEKYLVMYPPEEDRRIGEPDSEEERTLKQRAIEAFDKLLNEPSSEELVVLWEKIRNAEKGLYKELKRKIYEYSNLSDA